MRLISVNLGNARGIQIGTKLQTTGIFKTAVNEPVEITSSGLSGDSICDSKNHGGPDQAVYVYGMADYAWWSKELHREFHPGTFGENLTIDGLESPAFLIGDRLIIGTVILEVTSPRIPCATLAARIADPEFVKRFRRAERPGLYCRVIQPGKVWMGLEVAVEKNMGGNLSLLEMFRLYYDRHKSQAVIHRMLEAPIAIRARLELVELLSNMTDMHDQGLD